MTSNAPSVTLKNIQDAAQLLHGVVVDTPCIYSPRLSNDTEADVYLKLEIFQATGAFKERGAYIKLKSLSSEQLKRGVIAVSAGNHAQAVAYHAAKMGSPATIVMPIHTPNTKVSNTEKWGAKVILEGQTLEDASATAHRLEKEQHLTFIHPYDDPHVIAGQGTIGLEILRDLPQLESLILPVGGGGLAAGIAIAAKSLKPDIKIYGVEIEGYTSMAETLYGTPSDVPTGSTLAEGIAVKSPGRLTSHILQNHLEDIFVVNESDTEASIDLLMRKQNVVAEGAGAVGVAALLKNKDSFKGQMVATVICGGNIDARILSSIAMRGRIRDGRIAMLRVQVDDVPGMLAKVCGLLGDQRANIIELKHQRLLYETPIKMANLDITIETRDKAHVQTIIDSLISQGLNVSQEEPTT